MRYQMGPCGVRLACRENTVIGAVHRRVSIRGHFCSNSGIILRERSNGPAVYDRRSEEGTVVRAMIEADDLRRTFNDVMAVAGITFSVERGNIFGLLGPNGAGKTTTIRMLTGQIDPTGGRARVAGCDVVEDRARLKTRIGVVFEDQNLYERLSAQDNLRFNCWLYNLPAHRVDQVLELVGLRDRAKSRVRTLSTGLKQRLMIARALLHEPPVLFLDEPTRGLDPISARDVRGIIEQLRREGTDRKSVV